MTSHPVFKLVLIVLIFFSSTVQARMLNIDQPVPAVAAMTMSVDDMNDDCHTPSGASVGVTCYHHCSLCVVALMSADYLFATPVSLSVLPLDNNYPAALLVGKLFRPPRITV